MGVLTCILFLLEVRGYSRLYDSVQDSKYGMYTLVDAKCAQMLFVNSIVFQFNIFNFGSGVILTGWWTIAGSVIAFLMFTDCLIYFIHRGLHHKLVYKHFHKYHHLWKVNYYLISINAHISATKLNVSLV